MYFVSDLVTEGIGGYRSGRFHPSTLLTTNRPLPVGQSCALPDATGRRLNVLKIKESSLKEQHGAWHPLPPIERWMLDAGRVPRSAEHPNGQRA